MLCQEKKKIYRLAHGGSETMKSTKHEIRNPKQYRNSNVRIFKTYCLGNLNFGFHSKARQNSAIKTDCSCGLYRSFGISAYSEFTYLKTGKILWNIRVSLNLLHLCVQWNSGARSQTEVSFIMFVVRFWMLDTWCSMLVSREALLLGSGYTVKRISLAESVGGGFWFLAADYF